MGKVCQLDESALSGISGGDIGDKAGFNLMTHPPDDMHMPKGGLYEGHFVRQHGRRHFVRKIGADGRPVKTDPRGFWKDIAGRQSSAPW